MNRAPVNSGHAGDRRGTTSPAASPAIGASAKLPAIMSPEALDRAIAKLWDGNRTHAAETLGLSLRTLQRHLAGEIPVSGPLALLLAVMLEHDISRYGVDNARSARWLH